MVLVVRLFVQEFESGKPFQLLIPFARAAVLVAFNGISGITSYAAAFVKFIVSPLDFYELKPPQYALEFAWSFVFHFSVYFNFIYLSGYYQLKNIADFL